MYGYCKEKIDFGHSWDLNGSAAAPPNTSGSCWLGTTKQFSHGLCIEMGSAKLTRELQRTEGQVVRLNK